MFFLKVLRITVGSGSPVSLWIVPIATWRVASKAASLSSAVYEASMASNMSASSTTVASTIEIPRRRDSLMLSGS